MFLEVSWEFRLKCDFRGVPEMLQEVSKGSRSFPVVFKGF